MSLDPRAVAAANAELWKAHPELKGRQLTAAPADAALRAEWMADYTKAKSKPVVVPFPSVTPATVALSTPPVSNVVHCPLKGVPNAVASGEALLKNSVKAEQWIDDSGDAGISAIKTVELTSAEAGIPKVHLDEIGELDNAGKLMGGLSFAIDVSEVAYYGTEAAESPSATAFGQDTNKAIKVAALAAVGIGVGLLVGAAIATAPVTVPVLAVAAVSVAVGAVATWGASKLWDSFVAPAITPTLTSWGKDLGKQ